MADESTIPTSAELRLSRDENLAAVALDKRQRGIEPNRTELAALRRIIESREDIHRRALLAALPKKDYLTYSGRQAKVVNDQSDRYGIPAGGPTVNIPDLIRWLHDFLKENAHALARAQRLEASDQTDATGLPHDEIKRQLDEEDMLTRRLKRLEMERQLIDRNAAHSAFQQAAGILRQCNETLRRQFGNGAGDLFEQSLTDAVASIDRYFQRIEPTTDTPAGELFDTSAPPRMPDTDPAPDQAPPEPKRPTKKKKKKSTRRTKRPTKRAATKKTRSKSTKHRTRTKAAT